MNGRFVSRPDIKRHETWGTLIRTKILRENGNVTLTFITHNNKGSSLQSRTKRRKRRRTEPQTRSP